MKDFTPTEQCVSRNGGNSAPGSSPGGTHCPPPCSQSSEQLERSIPRNLPAWKSKGFGPGIPTTEHPAEHGTSDTPGCAEPTMGILGDGKRRAGPVLPKGMGWRWEGAGASSPSSSLGTDSPAQDGMDVWFWRSDLNSQDAEEEGQEERIENCWEFLAVSL